MSLGIDKEFFFREKNGSTPNYFVQKLGGTPYMGFFIPPYRGDRYEIKIHFFMRIIFPALYKI